MPQFSRTWALPRRWLPWIGAGVFLRLLLVWFPRPIDDDTQDYLQLGHNLLHYGTYGLGRGGDLSPSLFRMPGYPIVLAAFEAMFARFSPGRWMTALFLFQITLDVLGGVLLAAFVRRHISGRAAYVALALAMLCPFTAAFAGIALTESLSVFAVSLGIYAAGRVLSAEYAGAHDWAAILFAGVAAGLAAMLRPDGALFCIALAAGLFWYVLRPHTQVLHRRLALIAAVRVVSIFGLVALLPIALWTARNWTDFHVFQPLAPRHLEDPGERYNAGFYRWLRTWSADFETTENVFWSVGEADIQIKDLPPRAFDSLDQRARTLALIADYNRAHSISADLDSRFAALATERIHADPLRYYVVLPALRLLDMLFRPSTWTFRLDSSWWRWSDHPGESIFAVALGLINLFYVGAAAWAFTRGQVPWAWMLGGYLLARFTLLASLENPEPRYVLECFPVFVITAAAALAHRPAYRPVHRRPPADRAHPAPELTGVGRPHLLCDNPKQTVVHMLLHRYRLLAISLVLIAVPSWCKSAQQASPNPAGPPPLVLTGGTVVDVTDWGHSARDLRDAVVIIREGHITDVGPSSAIQIPKDGRIIDCTGKFIIPGLIDGYAGMNSQGQANANLYMGVTTIVVRNDREHGTIDFAATPRPNLYPIDTVGTTDNWSLLARRSEWETKLHQGLRVAELSPEDSSRQLADTAHLGTRAVLIGHNITAANTQWIVTRAHQLGLITYGEFVSTPYNVGIEAGIDALVHMNRYDLGLIPDELQRPLVDDPEGASAATAYDYSERIPPADPHVYTYARFLASHHAALVPTFSMYYVELPDHRNLWTEPAAAILNPAQMFDPSNVQTGELDFALPYWTRHLPSVGQRWMEESLRKKADQAAMRMWMINETIFSAYPHYLAASGAPVQGSMPGISMHTELELLVRLGLSPREALAAATNNYALQFGWNELGLIAPGRRADIVVVDADPTTNIWNARRISTLILEGNVLDRDALLKLKK